MKFIYGLLSDNFDCFPPGVTASTAKLFSRALYLGAKAIQLNSNSVQALLLKGAALRNMGRVQGSNNPL